MRDLSFDLVKLHYRRAERAIKRCARLSYGWLNWPGDIDIGADDVWAETVRDSSRHSLPSKAKLKNS